MSETPFGYLYQQAHYTEWRKKRLLVWAKQYGLDWFDGKYILELGAGEGDIGNWFAQIGAIVTSSDATDRHIEGIKARHPSVEAWKFNAEEALPAKHWDMIIHTGLLYHMDAKIIAQHINDLCYHCDHLILETLVVNSDDPTYNIPIKEAVNRNSRLAYSGTGARFTAAYIETLLDQASCTWERDDNSDLNSFAGKSGQHVYDWKVTNSGIADPPQHRRCWYVKSTLFS